MHSVAIAVSVDEAVELDVFRAADTAAATVDLGSVYPGDVFTISPRDAGMNELGGALKWDVPAPLTEIAASGSRIQLRVTGEVATDVEIGLTDDKARRVTLKLRIEQPPERPAAVNLALETNERERAELRARRRAERRAFRALPREERQRTRQERREERRELGESARALRRRHRELTEADSCGLPTERTIQRALERAIVVVDAARGALKTRGASDPEVAALLHTCLRWTPNPAQSAANDKVVARVLDMLAVARNSMAIATHGGFKCSGGCDTTTGAAVSQGSRGGVVTVCQLWTGGTGLEFPAANGLEDARAYALLHEFVHLSGPIPAGEKYFGGLDWATLKAEEALGMADGYAAFAWKLSGGGGAGNPG